MLFTSAVLRFIRQGSTSVFNLIYAIFLLFFFYYVGIIFIYLRVRVQVIGNLILGLDFQIEISHLFFCRFSSNVVKSIAELFFTFRALCEKMTLAPMPTVSGVYVSI
uniref:Uncharacterized protein n=1 Tax=Cacopsylla melanoneura TaxID=428564 RepID=A0A8D8MAA2_9HEMI